jgi:membrane protein DedA with SNARE-associated domain
MDLQNLATQVLDFVRANQGWAPVIAGVMAFCESLAFLSLLAPATMILLGIGALIGVANLSFWPVCLAAAIGASLGDWVSYEIGRYLEDRAHHIWPLSRYPEMVTKGEEFTKRWGVGAIFIGRFFGPARAVAPLIAGIFEMPRWSFQLANISSALIWALVLLAPGAGLFEWLRS